MRAMHGFAPATAAARGCCAREGVENAVLEFLDAIAKSRLQDLGAVSLIATKRVFLRSFRPLHF
jgi:hypothetical protein